MATTRSQFLSDLIAKHGPNAPLSACYAQLFSLGELHEMTKTQEAKRLPPAKMIVSKDSLWGRLSTNPEHYRKHFTKFSGDVEVYDEHSKNS